MQLKRVCQYVFGDKRQCHFSNIVEGQFIECLGITIESLAESRFIIEIDIGKYGCCRVRPHSTRSTTTFLGIIFSFPLYSTSIGGSFHAFKTIPRTEQSCTLSNF